MKKLLLILTLIAACLTTYSQNTVKNKDGNYSAIKTTTTGTTGAKPTGKTYTDSKGVIYPVLISKNGKLFIIRTSKAGNKYNFYLQVDKKTAWSDDIRNKDNKEYVAEVAFNLGIEPNRVSQTQFNNRYLPAKNKP